ncbi:FAD-NAD(P)-binding-domain-containing protein [Annulohypoxylon moriforme]|nr:FAD-NAD(P)-binding-domain-containing protein [Annulohypoxylon moriforme]
MSQTTPLLRPTTPKTQVIIGIVGMGPRGTSILERLVASAPEILLSRARLIIHVVDPSPPGPGRVWRINQPSDLLMNTVASQATLFTDNSVTCSGPIRPGHSLYDWAIRSDIKIKPNDYPTRALHGRYLEWFFEQQLENLPAGVEVKIHAARAISLEDDEHSGLQTLTLSNGCILAGISSVILAQGHLPSRQTTEQVQLANYAKDNGLQYFPPSNPADLDLSSIGLSASVLLRGLGLCFFDYLSLLTEGRGGKFEGTDTGLRYYPSGLEPRLHAASRRGIPYHARGDNQKGPSDRQFPIHLTDETIEKIRKGDNALDFRSDIWPLISKDVELVYYERLVGQDCPEFRDRFLAAQRENSPAEHQVLDEFNIPDNKRWSWSRILKPHGEGNFLTPNEWKSWLVKYLHSDVEEATLGNVQGPLKAALDMMRDLRNEIRQVVDHGRLSGKSYRLDLDGWYTPLNAFLSIGPPRHRIEQMIALIEAGVLHVLGPELEVCEGDGAWLARSCKVSYSTVRITTLIEARLPQPDLKLADDELISSLLRNGQCRPHVVKNTTFLTHDTIKDYETAGLDVTPSPYNLLDSQGQVHKRRFATGVPTEGVHWVTATAARPGVNSVLLQDTDAIARAALYSGRADVEM